MQMVPSIVDKNHPDYGLLSRVHRGISDAAGGIDRLNAEFPQTIRDAIDFVIDPIRTGRTQLKHLDNVEKTFVGLKIEHFIRDLLNAPKGIRDLVIDGIDVDIKNTLGNSWMIPPETYKNEDPCLVITSFEDTNKCWMGLLLARLEYLNAPNRDGKRGVKAGAVQNILWLVENADYPQSLWLPFDLAEFRELRQISHGTPRAAEFFRRNLEKPINRSILQALLFDQKDYMKRIRGNQGARDVLRKEGIAVLSGTYGNQILEHLGKQPIGSEEIIAVGTNTQSEYAILRQFDAIDKLDKFSD